MAGAPGNSLDLRIEWAKSFFRQLKTSLAALIQKASRSQSRRNRARRDKIPSAVSIAAIAALESSDLDEILTRVLQQVLPATGMHAGVIYLAEEGTERLERAVQYGLPRKLAEATSSVPRDEGLVGQIFRANEVLSAVALKTCVLLDAIAWRNHGYRSFVGARVHCGGKPAGVLALLSKGSRRFTKARARAVASLASAIGRLLEKARAQREIEGALIGMRRLSRANLETIPLHDSDGALDRLAVEVSEAAVALSSMVTLTDGQHRVVRRGTAGITRQAFPALRRMDIASKPVLETGKPLVVSSAGETGELLGEQALEAGIASCVCLPLRIGGQPLGVLWLNYETPREFPAWELDELQVLGDRVAAVIENARFRSAASEKIARYRKLHEHCVRIASCATLKDLLQALADSARETVGATTAVVSVSSDEAAEHAVSSARSLELNPAARGPGLRAAVKAETAERLRFVTATAEPASPEVNDAAVHRTRGSLAVHLLDEENKPTGILTVADKIGGEDFDQDDAELLDALARQATIAVRNLRARQQTEPLAEEWRALLDRLPLAIATVDRKQMLAAVNTAFEKLTGLAREEVEGKIYLFDLIPEAEREGESKLWRAEAVGAVHRREVQATLLTRDGSQKKVHVLVGEMHDGGNVAICLTELEEAAAVEATPSEERASSPWAEIALDVLSVLREPLASAAEHLEKLVHKQWPEDSRKSLDAVSCGLRECWHVLEEVTVLTEPRPIVGEPVGVNELITGIVDEKGTDLRREGVAVVLRLDANLPAVVADREQLRWALARLIDHCRVALRESQGPRTLTIQTERKGKIGRITVSDTRPAVPPESVQKLFEMPEPGSRGDSGQSGLTLAACRAIIEWHGWKISAESPAQGGIAFVIEHPVPEESPQSMGTRIAAEVVKPPSEKRPEAPSARNVLVIDDEHVVTELLGYYLRSEGHAVETARDGREGLKKLKTKDYDLIFCDIKLPGLSGQELFHWMEANKPTLSQRVIFITGDVATPETLSFLNDPPKRWLEKPFDLSELRQIIAVVLGQSREGAGS